MINVFLIPTGVYGYFRTDGIYLKIPLYISLLGSFSWIVFPNASGLLPDRWITIFGIFLSIFATYGFIKLLETRKIFSSQRKSIYLILFLAPFIGWGTAYALLPSDTNFSFTTLFHDYIGQFGPVTMQSNSISTQQSKDLLLTIDWINHYTPLSSNIIINKNLRGWMEIELKDRHFQFYNGNMTLLRQQKNNYFIKINDDIFFNINNTKLNPKCLQES